MSRPLTADLRGIEDDGRRWWAVAGNTYAQPWYYPARSGREAVAQHRRESIAADISMGFSQRDAIDFTRAKELKYGGPYTTQEAFVLDAGWTLAWAECDAYRSTLVPGGPLTDLDRCKPMLTDERIERLLDSIAENYRKATA
jgi:hypothetical protein